MNEQQLIDFISGRISDPAEMMAVMEWIDSSTENHKTYNDILNSWALSGIGYNEAKVNIDQQYKLLKIKKNNVRRIGEYLKYAAAVLTLFSLGFLAQTVISTKTIEQAVAWHEIIVPNGQSVELALSDSTKVWLNSGSKLKYPSNFSKEHRIVELNGEAFFDVMHDAQHPFVIATNKMDVKVLGTRLNVDAFELDEKTNVTLVSGRVDIQNKSGSTIAELLPNMNAEFVKSDKSLNISNVNVEFYTSWMNGIIAFKNESLNEIASKLEKWYSVKIVFDQEDIKTIKFSGSILKNKPIDQILEILTYISKIGYEMETNNNQPNVIHLKHLPMK